MIKLSKAQREQLIAIGIGAVALIAGLWFLVVTAQKKELVLTNNKCEEMRKKLSGAGDKIRHADKVADDLAAALEVLKRREVAFAPEHEPFAWMEEGLTHFLLPTNDIHRYKSVGVTDINQPEISDKGTIASFPYKWARFHVTAQGYYHDFGKFIADYESTFIYFHIEGMDISVPRISESPEVLSFSFDIVAPQLASEAPPPTTTK